MRETLSLIGSGMLLLLILAYTGLRDISNSLWLTTGYGLLLFIPATLYFAKKQLVFSEKFFLSILTGFCFGAVFVAGDILFQIPLKIPTYIIVTTIFFIGGILVWKKDRERQK